MCTAFLGFCCDISRHIKIPETKLKAHSHMNHAGDFFFNAWIILIVSRYMSDTHRMASDLETLSGLPWIR